ncbi:hypothetical protein F383_28623 [Gossypium arboreum]|uniref:Uncharacterized protein n=1 Tax=Gossypium arboreum TaxID=29729 RepID=A0A0B0PCZ2_GOSAR|nr:hypothetical protein F383_28623 [Gossypium arboreum]
MPMSRRGLTCNHISMPTS